MTQTTRDAVASHGPEKRVQAARLGAEEVPGRVVGSSSLRDLIVRARLDRVDQVREPDGILDEEDGDVVSDNVWLG